MKLQNGKSWLKRHLNLTLILMHVALSVVIVLDIIISAGRLDSIYSFMGFFSLAIICGIGTILSVVWYLKQKYCSLWFLVPYLLVLPIGFIIVLCLKNNSEYYETKDEI
jgi:hypothetical protein